MSEFDDKLNSILSNPDAMSQIMQLAQSLSGSDASEPVPSPAKPSGPDLSSLLSGNLDPGLLVRLLPILQELGNQQDSNARQLLYALRPYLKPARQENIEKALQLARLFHLGKKFLKDWEG